MKKTQFILFRGMLLLFLISGLKAALAQTWPMPGATWKYCITSGGSPAGFNEMIVAGDTIIDGATYKIIEHIEEYENRRLYTRYSNDTVYRNVNGQEYMYFTYNLEVGDVYTTFRSLPTNWSDSTCSSTMPLKVISSEMVELDGEMIQQWTLRDTLYDDLYGNDALRIDYTLVQRIGIINSYPFINPNAGWNCFPVIDAPKHSLGTYEDNGFYHMFEECEGTGIEDRLKANNRIRITPNPAHDYFEIEFLHGRDPGKYKVTVYDVTGQFKLRKIISDTEHQINITNLEPGYYLIRLSLFGRTTGKITKSLIIH